MPATLTVDDDPGAMFTTIQAAVNAAPDGDTIDVAAGTYTEAVTVNKSVSLVGAGAAVTTVTAPAGADQALFSVAATGVTIQDFGLAINQPNANAGIRALSTEFDGLLILGNTFTLSGTGGTSPRGVDITDATSTRTVTIKGNTFTAAGAALYSRGIALSQVKNAIVGGPLAGDGNVFGGAGGRDFRLADSSGSGTSTVQGNTFNSAGLEIVEPIAGVIDVLGNTFAPAGSYRDALTVNHNFSTFATVNVTGNQFTGNDNFGVFIAASFNVAVTDNTFTPLPGDTTFAHVVADTQMRNGTQFGLIVPVSFSLQGNAFNGSGVAGGVGLAVFNGNSTGSIPNFGTVTIGGAGALANTFGAALASFIQLNTGANPAFTPPAVGSPIPGPVTANFDATGNKYGVAGNPAGLLPSAMTTTQLFEVEDKVTHATDTAALGFVRVLAGNVFVTPTSASIQRGIDAATTGDTVNVQTGTYAGAVDAVTGGKNINLSPGSSPGQVVVNGNLLLNAGDTLTVELAGTSPVGPVEFDNLVVNGSVTLGGATLAPALVAFVPPALSSFKIIDNDGTADPVIGTFAGLPNGTTFNVSGVPFQIFYTGGDGNDVVLRQFVDPTVLYVDDTFANPVLGQDPDGPGPATVFGYDAFATIQAAVDAATPGDVIRVAAGTYPENVVVDVAVTILGAQANVVPTGRTLGGAAESTVNPAAGGQVFQVTTGGVVIDGFSITTTGTTTQGVNESTGLVGTEVSYNLISGFITSIGVAVTSGSTNTLVRFNDISNNYAGVYLSANATGTTVSQNVIHNNVGTGVFDSGSGIVFEGNNTSVTVTQNSIRDNAGTGVYVFTGFGTDFSGTRVVGNSITGNTAGAVVNTNATTLDAPANWWGSNVEATIQAAVGANVDYAPWLNVGTDLAPGTFGFQGDLSFLIVSAASPVAGGASQIGQAVDLIADGSLTGGSRVVQVLAGTYTGPTATLDAAVTVRGATGTAAIVIIDPTGAVAGLLVAANGVTVRDLTVTGATDGIAATAAAAGLTVTNVVLTANTDDGIDLDAAGGTTTLTGVTANLNGGDGLELTGTAGSVLAVDGLTATGNLGAGLTLSGFATVNLTDVTLTGNTAASGITGGVVNLTPTTGAVADAITATGTAVQFTRDPAGTPVTNQAITLSGVTALNLFGDGGADAFNVTPAAAGGATISANGGLPDAAPGDTLDLVLTGLTGATVSVTSSPTGLAGSFSFANAEDVVFSRIESLADTATVTGQVFNDANGDGSRQAGEGGLAGVTVQLDVDANGTVDQTTTTDVNGTYTFTVVAPGPFRVRIATPTGGTVTTPLPADVTAAAGSTTAGVDFGVQFASGTAGTSTVTGVVFNDANTNGTRDAGEAGVNNLVVYLDLDFDGKLDANEPSTLSATVTGVAGTYTLTSSVVGTSAAVRVVEKPGFLQNTTNTTAALTDGATTTVDVGVRADLPPQATPAERFAVGVVQGNAATVRVFDATGKPEFEIPAGTGDVRVAVGDVTGDGVDDVIIGSGPGTQALIRVIDGVTRQEVARFNPFETFAGGVFVAVGDFNQDGTLDLIATPDQGGGPRVVVVRGGDFQQVASFFGIDDPNFRGGARASMGDLNADGRADLIVAAGFGGGPRVAVFDGTFLPLGQFKKLMNDFFVFEDVLRNGVYVGSGDFNGDGFDDLVVGAGPGGGPRVMILSGQVLQTQGIAAALASPLANFFAGNPSNRGGIRVVAKDLDRDGRAELLTGDGTGSQVTGYGEGLGQEFAFDSGSDDAGSRNGVFVG